MCENIEKEYKNLSEEEKRDIDELLEYFKIEV